MNATPQSPPRAARFWNRIAAKYARDPVANQAAYEEKLNRTAKRMLPDMAVLEFGCGTGTTALIHAPRVARIDAVDFSSSMIDIARGKAAADGVANVEFHISSVEAWPADAGYDMVMAHSLLHLVDDLDAVLAHIRACLRPGGLFVSSTVCIRDMNALLPLILPLGGWTGVIPRVIALRASQLVARISAAGFEIEEEWRPDARSSIFLIARKPAGQ